MEEKVTVISKRKAIQPLFDYCMDQKIMFTVSSRPMISDEFEIETHLGSIKQAIALGMFLKENKFDVFGLGEFAKPKANGNSTKKADAKESGLDMMTTAAAKPAEENATVLNF